jgi:glyoxylase-like metal-dependent hydrolase (beta-lactamase superfamily II)
MDPIVSGVYPVPGTSKSFLVDGDQGVTLIDTGMPRHHKAIARVLDGIGRTWSDVRAIAVTHSHADHVGSAAAVKRQSGAPLFASAADAPAIRGDEPTVPPPVFDRFRFLLPLFRVMPGAEDVAVDHLVGENDPGPLPEDLSVVDTPGHTPGHLSYLLDRAGGVLFVGDAAVATRRGEVKRGFMNASTPRFDASLRHIAGFDFDVALFAHSVPLLRGAAGAFRRFASGLG